MRDNFIIAAIRDPALITAACSSAADRVFLLSGGIIELPGYCRLLRQAGKQVFLHVDLLSGLKADSSGISFLCQHCQPSGVISTKVPCLKAAKEAGLQTILRCFIIDSSALHTGAQLLKQCKPDYVEVLPGVSSKIIGLAVRQYRIPVIAGGLIDEAEDIKAAMTAGAAAVSTSQPGLWA